MDSQTGGRETTEEALTRSFPREGAGDRRGDGDRRRDGDRGGGRPGDGDEELIKSGKEVGSRAL